MHPDGKFLYQRNMVIYIAAALLLVLSDLTTSCAQEEGRTGAAPLAPRTRDEQQVIDAYKQVNRAVVNVSTRAEAMNFFGPTAQEGTGSGVIIDAKKGYIVTNVHVIEGAQQMYVTLSSGQRCDVKIVGIDVDTEIALLQLVDPPEDLTQAIMGDSSALEVGQRVLAIGNPFGLNRTLTVGVVSSLERSIQAQSGQMIEDVIQTDAPINPGNSGGPLLDTAGRLVGINTAILSHTGENAGIGFAVPVNTLRRVLPQLLKYGKVLRPKIGVILVDTEIGPAFAYVQKGSPADAAGLAGARKEVHSGFFVGYSIDFSGADFVLEINGHKTETKAEVLDMLSKADANSPIEMLVRRGFRQGKTRTVKVKPILG